MTDVGFPPFKEDGDSDQRLEDAAAVITHLQDELEDLRAKIRRLEESSFGGYAEETTLRVAEAVEKATKVMEERLKQSEEKCGDLAKDNSELRGELVNLQLEMQEVNEPTRSLSSAPCNGWPLNHDVVLLLRSPEITSWLLPRTPSGVACAAS